MSGCKVVADRLTFKVVRVRKVTQFAECDIDVNDPTNVEEITNKLKEKDFVKFLVLDEEIMEDDNWSFQPINN